ncbi:MAG TPA: hypothetical protein DCG75_13930 [Bacteroidales bacterium]|jgi:hypothetical protein|nr:hypothetical protein [Bacteroidales bacterium]
MIENLKNSIKILKQKVRFNLDLIHQYELEVKEILKEPVSEDRSEKLSHRFLFSKKILNENADAIKLQREIMNYLENYHNDIVDFSKMTESNRDTNNSVEQENEIVEISKDDYFNLTIKGEIMFDVHHPYFNDECFLNSLLSYFISVENYEMCSQIVELDKSKNLS